jgi:hypothetical protein
MIPKLIYRIEVDEHKAREMNIAPAIEEMGHARAV